MTVITTNDIELKKISQMTQWELNLRPCCKAEDDHTMSNRDYEPILN